MDRKKLTPQQATDRQKQKSFRTRIALIITLAVLAVLIYIGVI